MTRRPKPKDKAEFKFRLYVAGDVPNSAQAVANLTALCKTYLANRHAIEVVNVFHDPKRALADGILMTPMLVKLAPLPAPTKIIGTPSQTQPVLLALGIETTPG